MNTLLKAGIVNDLKEKINQDISDHISDSIHLLGVDDRTVMMIKSSLTSVVNISASEYMLDNCRVK